MNVTDQLSIYHIAVEICVICIKTSVLVFIFTPTENFQSKFQ